MELKERSRKGGSRSDCVDRSGSTRLRPLEDGNRLAALRRVGLLDTPPEEAYDRLTRLAARLLRAPVALVTLVEPHRQFFKSAFGLPEPAVRETPLSHSFCQHVVMSDAPLVVNDAREHPLVCDSAAVKDSGVVAYLGVPFRTPAGEVLGSICVVDLEPRVWHEEDQQALEDLAAVLAGEVKLRETTRRREASERFLRATMNALSAHIAVLDERGVIVATNEAWRRFGRANGGASEAAGVGADYLAVCDAAGAEGATVAAAIRGALKGHDGDFTMEYPCHSPDEQRWFEVRVTRFPGEVAPRVVVAHEDVTDRRLADEALRESEVRFRSFVEATAQVVWQADATGAVTELSEAWSAFTGQHRRRVTGWDWLHALHPEDRERVAEEWAACVANRAPYQTVYRVRTRSGGYHRFNVRAVPVYAGAAGTAATGGRFLGWAGTATDVEEQYRAEEALARSEERLRLALRAAEMGTWDTGLVEGAAPDEGTVTWSSQTLALFGLGEEAAVGPKSTFYDLIVEEDRARVREETAAAIRRAAEGGPPELTVDYRLRRGDGAVRWFRSTGRVVLNEAGRPERMVGTVLDVTEAKVYEAALVEAKEAAEEARRRAEEASRLKSSLLANMSHEIRTPLTGIIGFADVLAEEVEAEHGEFARSIGLNGRRLLETLNAVLELARLEAGEVPLGRDELDLRAVVAEAVAPFVPRAGAKGLGLTVSLHPEPVLVESDARALGRVVSHLVSNAVKFTEEGGVSVAVRAGAAGAEVRVADTGVGIAPSFRPRLFEAFWQESDGDERSHEGNGLGLVITQRLVERVGGTIEVASEKGVGSTFTVRLPGGRVPQVVGATPTSRMGGGALKG